MSTYNNLYAREERRDERRRTWLVAKLSGLAVLAAITFSVVCLALTRQF